MTRGKDAIFRFNPGREGVLFPPHHPYYGKRISSREAQEIRENLSKLTEHRPLTPEQKAYRKEVLKRLKEQYKGKLARPIGCPEEVLITSSSIEEVVNQPFNNVMGKLDAIKNIDNLINSSTWLGKVKPRPKDMHESFIARTEVDGIRSYLIFVKHKGTPLKFYSISDSNLEGFLEK